MTVVHSEDAYRALGGGEPSGRFPNEPGVRVRSLRTAYPIGAATATYLSGRPAFYSRQLQDALGSERFDVVHFHTISLAGGPGVLRYGSGVKLYTTSEHWLVCPMHVLFRENREPCVQPHCLRCSLAFGRPPQLWRYTSLLDRAVPNVDLFLAPSRFTLDAHRARGFTAPMRHLPHFLPETDISGAGVGSDPGQAGVRPHDRAYALVVGRLERIKGVHVAIEAFRSYRELDLVIAGDGEQRAELERQAAGLDHVRFLGHVDQAELPALYANATALVVPSIGYEVFGLVLLEAFARRTPAVVQDLGALPEIVGEAGGGVTYRTAPELTDALEALRSDPSRRQQLGDAGYDALRRLWSEEAHLDAYFDLIEEARRLRPAPAAAPTKLGRR